MQWLNDAELLHRVGFQQMLHMRSPVVLAMRWCYRSQQRGADQCSQRHLFCSCEKKFFEIIADSAQWRMLTDGVDNFLAASNLPRTGKKLIPRVGRPPRPDVPGALPPAAPPLPLPAVFCRTVRRPGEVRR